MTPERILGLYKRLPARVRDAIPVGTALWLRDRALPRLTGAGRVPPLEARLWGGFSRGALPGLEALTRSGRGAESAKEPGHYLPDRRAANSEGKRQPAARTISRRADPNTSR